MISFPHPQTGKCDSFLLEQEGNALVITPLEDLRQIPAGRFANDLGDVVGRLTPETQMVVVDLGHAFDQGTSDRLLGLLCMLWKRAQRNDTILALCNLTPQARHLMSRTRLDRVWPIYGSRTAALRALG